MSEPAPLVVDVAGRAVRITHPDKVLFPARGETKRDLVAYYTAVAAPMLREVGGRPVMMQRFPQGAAGPSFFQKRVPANAPAWLTSKEVSTPNGTTSNALVLADLAHVLWAVNLGCLGFHAFAARADDLEHPDELRIDLDPSPGVTFPEVRAAGHEVKRCLDELGIRSFAKTSGSRGLHVYVRIERRYTAVEVRAAAVALARALEKRRPDLVTASWWKEERGRRVFLDFNQNAPHKTVFAAWSVRATPNAQVSTPIGWDELDDAANEDFTLASVPARLAARGDPWAAIDDVPQSLEPLLDLAARDRAAGPLDAPWPPVYPKQPGEPPRVAPSRARKGRPR